MTATTTQTRAYQSRFDADMRAVSKLRDHRTVLEFGPGSAVAVLELAGYLLASELT